MGDLSRIEARSLTLHRAVAVRLLADPQLWVRARQRLAEWRSEGLRLLPLVEFTPVEESVRELMRSRLASLRSSP